MFQHKKSRVFVSQYWTHRRCHVPDSKLSMRLWRCFHWPETVCPELPLTDWLVCLPVTAGRSVPRPPPAPSWPMLASRPAVRESRLLTWPRECREDPCGRAASMTSRLGGGVPPPGPSKLVDGGKLVSRWPGDLWSGRRSGEWRPVETMAREAVVSRMMIRGMVVSGTVVMGMVVSGTMISGMVISGVVVRGMVVSGMVVRGMVISGVVVRGMVISGVVVRGMVVSGVVVRGMVISGVVVRGMVISGVVVSGTVIMRMVISEMEVSGMVVGGVVIMGMVISGTVVMGMVISKMEVSGTVVGGVVDGGMVVSGMVISGTVVMGVVFRGMVVSGTVISWMVVRGQGNIGLLNGHWRDDGLRPVKPLMAGVLRRKSAEGCQGLQKQLGGGCLTVARACWTAWPLYSRWWGPDVLVLSVQCVASWCGGQTVSHPLWPGLFSDFCLQRGSASFGSYEAWQWQGEYISPAKVLHNPLHRPDPRGCHKKRHCHVGKKSADDRVC